MNHRSPIRGLGVIPQAAFCYTMAGLDNNSFPRFLISPETTAFHRLSRSVNLEYYAFLVFANYLIVTTPSACFHTYIEYQNQTLDKNSVITFKQNVFRNEGRLNYKEKGRLMDYHVREIVFIGDEKFVEKQRLQLMKDSEVFMKEHQLEGDISLATDSFVLPKMQMYKTIQKIDKTKYEMHLNVEKDKNISVASFNLHGKAFTDPFNISVKDTDTVTGCVGFGLQRWVIAFVCQYGWDEQNWPEKIKKAYMQKKD